MSHTRVIPMRAASLAPVGSGATRQAVRRHRSSERYRSGWFAHHAERWEKTCRLIGRTQIQQNDLEAVCRLACGGQIP